MNTIRTFTVIGGDERQLYMKRRMEEYGFRVLLFGFDRHEKGACNIVSVQDFIKEADAVVLPIPVSRDGTTVNAPYSDTDILLDDLPEIISARQPVFCGMLSLDRRSQFFRKGIRVYDYADRDEFSIKNAVPTAEGAVAIAIEKLPVTVKDAKIAVTGYGRTAKAIAASMKALGAKVTVAARKCSSLANADNDGCTAIYLRELHKLAGTFDMLVNTVPSIVIDETVLKCVRRDCVIVEIASAPYGIDFDAAKKLGLSVVSAASLPGKVAPKSAGIIISETILNIIREGSE